LPDSDGTNGEIMPTREMLAALLLLTTVSGAAWGQCIDLYKTPAGSWGCGLPEPGGLYPYPVETENYGGTDGLTVWSLPTGANALPYAAKYVGVPFAPDGGGILIAPGVILMQAGWRLDTAVQWTARKAGIVSFSGFFEELQQMPIGTQLYIFYDQTDTTASAFSNGTGYLAGPGANLTTLRPGGKANFAFQLTVVPGDNVIFVVQTHGIDLRADDLLGFRVHVTPVP
jgi:hypothetical protein